MLLEQILLLLLVAIHGCSGCHDTRIEEAGKAYRDTKEQDSAISQLQKLENETEVVEIPSALQGCWVSPPFRKQNDSATSRISTVAIKNIEFKMDRVFVYYRGSQFRGTWNFDNGTLNLNIESTHQFDYSLVSLTNDLLCLRLPKSTDIECFSKLNFNKATY